jgi:hypothetical protein
MRGKWGNVTLQWDGGKGGRKGGSLSNKNITGGLGWGFGMKLLLRLNRNQDVPQFLT